MDNITELFSVFHKNDRDDWFESYFVGAFTSEAFAVEGFQQWIKEFLNSSHEENKRFISLIESINKCSSIKEINKVYADFSKDCEEDVNFMCVIRHRPNEIIKKSSGENNETLSCDFYYG